MQIIFNIHRIDPGLTSFANHVKTNIDIKFFKL